MGVRRETDPGTEVIGDEFDIVAASIELDGGPTAGKALMMTHVALQEVHCARLAKFDEARGRLLALAAGQRRADLGQFDIPGVVVGLDRLPNPVGPPLASVGDQLVYRLAAIGIAELPPGMDVEHELGLVQSIGEQLDRATVGVGPDPRSVLVTEEAQFLDQIGLVGKALRLHAHPGARVERELQCRIGVVLLGERFVDRDAVFPPIEVP